ncbi:hypothetical protein SAMN06265338_10980 [Rhodoblastus acidophilus]|uniref:Uncharacterized protein n=1 Tax=Rhodoblastus acidophilus TaxID=1074 RepID=A0A212RZB4_RHOAC|nr:hypothetical protein [Rhodoblastus acidophilus]MCW2314964.1 hypothetical protein [Rhodoblastus acidophilus]PPQ36928.1 hypothetical protein CKO16_16155 [Rhodoblastus acidophilus]RAI22466.1 hypothetical protein CH337_04900 [Rhodoblastus acidophilus]SNB78199.1 hypothetical protein SAMN06265338_10980 [Rhodoblastus acidophilus]
MADYYPLLARAVAALPNSTPETRKAIYERAKKALLGQLHAMQPPPPAGAIDREASALDEAVSRLEREFAAAGAKAAAESATPPARTEQSPAPDPYPGDDEDMADDSRRDETPARDNLRPAAPRPAKEETGGLKRLLIICGALVVVVGLVGFAAWKLRDRPEDLAKLSPPADTANEEAGSKIGQRIGGEPAAQSAPPPAAAPALPISYRAAVLTRDPSEPGGVKTYVGSVVWRRDSTNRGPNQQLVSAISADIEIADAKLKASLLIEKNFDPSLSFSHTINVRFFPAEGSPIGAVNAIGMPEMRADDAPKGVALQGLPVQIAANAFLAGLTQVNAEQNRTLLEAPNWMDIQLSLANGAVAKITMEKGPGGRKVFADVFAEWANK